MRGDHHERDQIGAFIINCCAILKQIKLKKKEILVASASYQDNNHARENIYIRLLLLFFCSFKNKVKTFIKEKNFENEQ